jgi:hypothetical protein
MVYGIQRHSRRLEGVNVSFGKGEKKLDLVLWYTNRGRRGEKKRK